MVKLREDRSSLLSEALNNREFPEWSIGIEGPRHESSKEVFKFVVTTGIGQSNTRKVIIDIKFRIIGEDGCTQAEWRRKKALTHGRHEVNTFGKDGTDLLEA